MRIALVALALTATVAHAQSPAPSASAKPVAATASIHWVTTWKEAWNRSRNSKRPVLLMFCTSWSPWCQKMDTTVWTLPQVRALSTRYVMCRLDAEKDVLLANKFRVTGYPTILLNYEGQALGRDVGLVPAAHLVDMMQRGLHLMHVDGTP